MSISEIWFPEFILINSGRLFERWPESVVVGAGGEMTYLQRVSGSLASYHTLHDFPFDTQSIDISFIPLDYSPQEVLLELDEDVPRIEMENEQEIKTVESGRVGNKTLGEDEEEKIVKVGEKIFANGKY